MIWYDDLRRTWYVTCDCGARRKIPSPQDESGLSQMSHRRDCAKAHKNGWKIDGRGVSRRKK